MCEGLKRCAVGAAVVIAAVLTACATTPAQPAHPDFTGTWSGWLTTQDDPSWRLEDYVCFPGCPKVLHDTLAGLLDDPANDDAPTDALMGQAMAAMVADRNARSTPQGLALIEQTSSVEDFDLASYCEPYGFVREVTNTLPMIIREEEGGLAIDYEEFNQSRTVHMDGRSPPAELAPSPLGWSAGRYEGDALVIDTVGLKADDLTGLASPTVHWGGYADGASAVERYVIKENPRRLVLELTLTDPVTLTEPYVWTKTWLSTPGVALLEDSCEDVPGQFGPRQSDPGQSEG
jgi:hypothetical protein